MTPLQQRTKARYETERGTGSWDLLSERSQEKSYQAEAMRVALLTVRSAIWRDCYDII